MITPNHVSQIIPVTAKNLAYLIAGDEESKFFSSLEAATFLRKAYEKHPHVVAELLRELCSIGCEPYTKAYQITMSGIYELCKFDPESHLADAIEFFKRIECLKGSSSEVVKSDVAQILILNIEAAEELNHSAIIEYTKHLAAILQNDATSVLRTMELSKDASNNIATAFEKILSHHPAGTNVVGVILARVSMHTARSMHSNHVRHVQILGKILGHVENAINIATVDTDERMEIASSVISLMSEAAKICQQQDRMSESIRENFDDKIDPIQFRIEMHNIVSKTYRQMLDPCGSIASGSFGEKEQKEYLDRFAEFETLILRGHESTVRKNYLASSELSVSKIRF